MKQVFSTTSLSDAELVRILLRNYGIESLLQGVDPGLSGPATPITLSVGDAVADQAISILTKEGKIKAEAPPAPTPPPPPAAPPAAPTAARVVTEEKPKAPPKPKKVAQPKTKPKPKAKKSPAKKKPAGKKKAKRR